uniref:Odorant receptor n=1 Tax=Culicoides sonorensis TaxID=179676 RepID=A0A336LSY4_CULSO
MEIEKLILKFKQGFLIFGIDFENNFKKISIPTKISFLSWTLLILFMSYQSLYWYFTIHNAPGVKFLLGTVAAGLIIFQIRVVIMLSKKSDLQETLTWIIARYNHRSDPIIEHFANPRFQHLITLFTKINNAYGLMVILSTIILLILPLFMNSVDYILPFHITFFAEKGFPYFEINYICQSFICILASLATALYISLYVLILTHIIVELNVILEMCQMVGGYEEWLFELEEVLVNDEKMVPLMPVNCQKFEVIIKNIVNMHNDVSDIINTVSDFYSLNIFLWEILFVSMKCFTFLIITVYTEMSYMIPLSIAFISQYFVICFLSTKMGENYDEIGTQIYSSKWYYLTKWQKRELFIVMNFAQQSKTLTSGGMADLTLERFTTVMKFTYNLCLLLQHFIKKN